MTLGEFIDYYENHHVPLILSTAPAPTAYKRNYVDRGGPVSAIDCDAIVEQEFADRAAFDAWLAAVTTGPAGERVAADEARFLDRSRTRACVVAESGISS